MKAGGVGDGYDAERTRERATETRGGKESRKKTEGEESETAVCAW